MLFNSFPFLFLFLPIVLITFFALSKYRLTKLATGSLVVASLLFYAYWDYRYVPLLATSILFNYFLGRKIAAERLQTKVSLIIGLIFNLLLLGYFKYTNFFLGVYDDVFGTGLPFQHIILPLGISFFTFTQIAYLVDAYRGETEDHHYSLLNYSLFVTFFPHLIAGPILHHRHIIPQFERLRHFLYSPRNMAQGITLFVLGLFKKVIIADNLAGWAQPVFEQAAQANFIEAWSGALAYTMQLYFDFSGYSDMAIGLGLMLNIQLPINFNAPYRSKSIIEFWRRWHITLSMFLKDYLYIPLGGNRFGNGKRMRNLLVTMLLGGLWHGAGWTYIIWGGLHGGFLVINHTWRKVGLKLPDFLAWLLTFICVVVAWVFFRAQSVQDALFLLKAMAGLKGFSLMSSLPRVKSFYVGIGIITFFSVLFPTAQQLLVYLRPKRWIATGIAVLALISILHFHRVAEFLYYQF